MKERIYVRDKRSPPPTDEAASRLMSAIKGKDTTPELLLRKALRDLGLRGYRVHTKDLPGRPDIAFPRFKVAVFVHGCYWHRCPICSPHLPRANSDYWRNKFERNLERDARKKSELEALGWQVITIWEHEIREDVKGCALSVRLRLSRAEEEA